METRRVLREIFSILFFAVTAALLLRVFVVGALRIPTPSMERTLLVGDALLVNKLAYLFHEPRRGDVIVFDFPFSPDVQHVDHYVKRCVACPGDTVGVDDSGRVFVNGVEAFAPGEVTVQTTTEVPYAEGITRIVPSGCYYVLGDNRKNSSDSRAWGWVPRENIVGRATMVYWSRRGETVRWDRLGTLVR